MPASKIAELLTKMETNTGNSLSETSHEKPVLLVFLRHFGCVFCREAMKDIGNMLKAIERKGVQVCLVHMSQKEEAELYFKEFNISGILHISDPTATYYEYFGLVRGSFNQIFGLQVWLRTAEIAIKDPKLLSLKKLGDGFQMPGAFLIDKGIVKAKFIHRRASDRPDYMGLIDQCEL